jgi:hypothetical protein
MDRLLDPTARAERDHFWFRGFRRFVRPLVVQPLAELDRPRVLDCGCAPGHNLQCCDTTVLLQVSTSR